MAELLLIRSEITQTDDYCCVATCNLGILPEIKIVYTPRSICNPYL